MTKSHRSITSLFRTVPPRLAPVLLTCALGLAAGAEEAAPNTPPEKTQVSAEPKSAGEITAGETAASDAGHAESPDAMADEANADETGPAEAVPANAKGPVENQTTDAARQNAPVSGVVINGTVTLNVERAGQPKVDPQSQRIKPWPFNNNYMQQNQDPASRARAKQKRLEGIVRGVMVQVGLNDEPMLEYIAAHMANEDQARGPLRRKGEQLFLALKSARVNDVQIDELYRDFQKALDDDKARRMECEANLDAKIGYSRNSRLEAVLVLFGIVGDGALFSPLREPPRARGPIPARGQQQARPLDKATTPPGITAAPAVTAVAAPPRADAPAPQSSTAPAQPAAAAPHDAGGTVPTAKDRASFR